MKTRQSLFACSLSLLFLCACGDEVYPPGSFDSDGDGFTALDDCNDFSAAVNPDVVEVPYNGIDDDCDATTLDDDLDGDGYAKNGGGDCDDASSTIHPGADEVPYDGIDQDCSGSDLSDVDHDGFDGGASGDDCDDTRADVKPSGVDVCSDGIDQDCSGADLLCSDVDSDGDNYSPNDGDCNDDDAAINPGVAEVAYTGVDEDCDPSTLDDDLDLDGFTKMGGGDCDDDADTVFPGADEIPYDGIDQDCSGSDLDDLDLDGFAGGPSGTDCNDNDFTVNPAAVEVCSDHVDNDCDNTDNGCALTGDLPPAAADAYFAGEGMFQQFGISVAIAGDVNRDGFDDLLVGAPTNDLGGSDAGAAYLYYGPLDKTTAQSDSDATFLGEVGLDRAGFSVAGAGDVNGDGYDDLLIGAPFQDAGGADAGAVYLIYGPVVGTRNLSRADVKLIGENAVDRAGQSVAAAGDVNGDGIDDLVIGSGSNDAGGVDAGAAYIVYGPVTGPTLDLSLADVKLVGEAAGDGVGISVAGAGDVNGDGNDDVIVGAPGEDSTAFDAGAAYVVYGGSSGVIDLSAADVKLQGEAASDSAGTAVASAGDLNGDGRADVLVGAPGADGPGTDNGVVYVIVDPAAGTGSVTDAVARFEGEGSSNRLGSSVASAGDVNGDGDLDFAVGARMYSTPTVGLAGAAYIIYGPVSGTLDMTNAFDIRVVGTAFLALMGTSLSSGDLNGDGFADVAIGAPLDAAATAFAGAVYTILGRGM